MTLTISKRIDFEGLLNKQINKAYRDALDTALIDLANYLQKESPVGATGDLKSSWDVIPAKKARNKLFADGSVVNTAEAAEFRIRGRAPGKFPPFGEGSSIGQWAAQKGIPAFLVARKIATKGTDRWIGGAQANILKQDPVSLEYDRNSPVFTVFEKTLAEEWAKIQV